MKSKADMLAQWLEESPRHPYDLEAAALLRKLDKVYGAAFDVVMAKNNVASRAAYAKLVYLIKGKKDD